MDCRAHGDEGEDLTVKQVMTACMQGIRAAALLTLSALTVAAAGCRESTAPDVELRGDYVVMSVGGRALPANIGDASYPIMLLADTMHFDGAGTATRHWTLRQPSSLQPAPLTKLSEIVGYSVSGTTVTFFSCPPEAACSACPPGANCARLGPQSGQIAVGIPLVILDYGGPKYLYRRVR
jgi:hypothetical protein